MATMHSGYVVTLEADLREEDAEQTLNALRIVKGVASVTPVEGRQVSAHRDEAAEPRGFVVVEIDVPAFEVRGSVGPFETDAEAMEECRRAYRSWVDDPERCRRDPSELDPKVEQYRWPCGAMEHGRIGQLVKPKFEGLAPAEVKRGRFLGVFVWTARPSKMSVGQAVHCWEIVPLRAPTARPAEQVEAGDGPIAAFRHAGGG
jgi:hypothetical protein